MSIVTMILYNVLKQCYCSIWAWARYMMADSDTIWDQKSDNSNVNHFLWGITIYKGTHIIQGQAIAICNNGKEILS